ncbi:MAG: hypothetical protein ACREP7_17100 [Lysobacter sp.]
MSGKRRSRCCVNFPAHTSYGPIAEYRQPMRATERAIARGLCAQAGVHDQWDRQISVAAASLPSSEIAAVRNDRDCNRCRGHRIICIKIGGCRLASALDPQIATQHPASRSEPHS